jgi:hypothetical protein
MEGMIDIGIRVSRGSGVEVPPGRLVWGDAGAFADLVNVKTMGAGRQTTGRTSYACLDPDAGYGRVSAQLDEGDLALDP